MIDTFRCGHPRNRENTAPAGDTVRCRKCYTDYQRSYSQRTRQQARAYQDLMAAFTEVTRKAGTRAVAEYRPPAGAA